MNNWTAILYVAIGGALQASSIVRALMAALLCCARTSSRYLAPHQGSAVNAPL